MGICASSEHVTKQTKIIDSTQEKDKSFDQKIKKLLLLGAGESGKSTIFKQLNVIHGHEFSTEDRMKRLESMKLNIVESIMTLMNGVETFGTELNIAFSDSEKEYCEHVTRMNMSGLIDEETAEYVDKLWRSSAIQTMYENRSKLQIPDSAKHFLDKVGQVVREGYVPSDQDMFFVRVRTTGMRTNEFEVEKNLFQVYDVGGQRNERRKWIHLFDNVTAIVYVAAVSEYDQVMFEDNATNRVMESLDLFEQICSNECFDDSAVILFLNKSDLFEEKFFKFPLKKFYSDFEGETVEDGFDYFTAKFRSRNRLEERTIITHVTCATDTTNVRSVFDACKNIIVSKGLNKVGIV